MLRKGLSFPRRFAPEGHFLRDPEHCEECREHEATLQAEAEGQLSREALGHSGWSPLHYLSGEGFVYWWPELLALALAPGGEDLLHDLATFHLFSQTESWRGACSPAQAAEVARFLSHVREEHTETLEHFGARPKEVSRAARAWS